MRISSKSCSNDAKEVRNGNVHFVRCLFEAKLVIFFLAGKWTCFHIGVFTWGKCPFFISQFLFSFLVDAESWRLEDKSFSRGREWWERSCGPSNEEAKQWSINRLWSNYTFEGEVVPWNNQFHDPKLVRQSQSRIQSIWRRNKPKKWSTSPLCECAWSWWSLKSALKSFHIYFWSYY